MVNFFDFLLSTTVSVWKSLAFTLSGLICSRLLTPLIYITYSHPTALSISTSIIRHGGLCTQCLRYLGYHNWAIPEFGDCIERPSVQYEITYTGAYIIYRRIELEGIGNDQDRDAAVSHTIPSFNGRCGGLVAV